MAVTKEPAEALADSIKQNLKSINTTTQTTLNLLRALLGLDLKDANAFPKIKSTDAKTPTPLPKPTSKTTAQKPKAVRQKTKSDFQILEAPGIPSSVLPLDRRCTLATETFNAALKQLSDALKEKQKSGQATGCQSPDKGRTIPPENVLQNRSHNRGNTPPSVGKAMKAGSKTTIVPSGGTEITADCAIVALQCLHNSPKPSESPDLPLIRGAQILLDKLLGLCLTKQAVEQAWSLRGQILSRLHRVKKGKSTQSVVNATMTSLQCSLSTALHFKVMPDEADMLNVVMTFQLQVLKTGLLMGHSFIDAELVDLSKSSNPSSPAAVILRSVESNFLPAEKAGQQLHMLSQLLSRFCSILRAQTQNPGPLQVIMLDLTFSMLDIRCQSWKLLGHQPNLEREVWGLIARAIREYADVNEGWHLGDFDRLQSGIANVQKAVRISGYDHALPDSVSNLLAEAARLSGSSCLALSLLEEQQESTGGLSNVIRKCKIATIQLGDPNGAPSARLQAAEHALDAFKQPLKGRASELQDVLLHGARLRKAAIFASQDMGDLVDLQEAKQIQISLQACSIKLVYAFLRFVLRYVSSQTGDHTDPATARTQSEKQTAVFSSARKTIDAALSLAKCSATQSVILMEDTDAALKDCANLGRLIDEDSTTCLRISNLYWGWYLRGKQSGQTKEELYTLLQRSTKAVEHCSVEDQRQAFIVVKLERLASLSIDISHYDVAKFALRKAISTSITQGALTEAVEISLARHSSHAWNDSRLDAHILGACLRKLARIKSYDAVSDSDNPLFFDDNGLPEIHRAELLQKQLFATAEFPPPNNCTPQIVAMAELILDLCRQPIYDIYRLRFVRDLLVSVAKYPEFPMREIFSHQSIESYCGIDQHLNKKKCFLASYGPLLSICVELQWALLTMKPFPENLQKHVNGISAILSRCASEAELDAVVDDAEVVIRQLQAVADYAGMLNIPQLRLQTLCAVRKILHLNNKKGSQPLAECLTQIGMMHIRTKNIEAAGRSFAEAETLFADTTETLETRLSWKVSYADYFRNLGNNEISSEVLRSAHKLFDEFLAFNGTSSHSKGRLKEESLVGHAALAASRLNFDQGDLQQAISYARQCVRVSSGIWASLEKLWEVTKEHPEVVGVDNNQNSTIEETVNTTISIDHFPIQSMVKGAPFWPHVQLHFQALIQISSMYTHCGLYQDAVYYGNQAMELCKTIGSETGAALVMGNLAILHARSGNYSQAQQCVNLINPATLNLLPHLEAAAVVLDFANACMISGELSDARRQLSRAESLISESTSDSFLPNSAGLHAPPPLELRMTKLKLSEPKRKVGSKARGTVYKPTVSVLSKSRSQQTTIACPRSLPKGQITVSAPISAGRVFEMRDLLRTELELRSGNIKDLSMPLRISSESQIMAAHGGKHFVNATLMLLRALQLFGLDAVHCVLAETALAFPNKSSPRRPSGRVSALSAAIISTKAKVQPTTTPGTTNSEVEEISTKGLRPEDLLSNAHRLLTCACASDSNFNSSYLVHDMQRLLCRLSILLNAVGIAVNYSPARIVEEALKPKDVMLCRERFILETEHNPGERSTTQRWPLMTGPMTGEAQNRSSSSEAAMSMFVEDLPETWSIVSISLSEDGKEFLFSRVVTGQTPFILRIPLCRSGVDDSENIDFGYNDAREELRDIIANANATAHDARSQAEKPIRKIWWAEREALDQRLEALLTNMENIWLGGFKGILSQQRKSYDALTFKFNGSLWQSLDNHLPSRQKLGGGSKQKIQLHGHVLDLFIALGHPDENDLDDAIIDLLYFVVDILQFEGERNAYDEIDFDAILVDVLDSLRSYHEACSIDKTVGHTILILDKELHAFPWESLPCLMGKPVSRMPSMGFVQHRLKRIKAQDSDTCAYVVGSSGAYVLNPSADLVSTQTTFEGPFQSQLPHFTSIIGRKPSEGEFGSLLRDSDLFLYFGHGSGAQYIRGRRIKQLDRCAVTFLMGCSSGKMTECGAYESYGVPWNYMHAGSMAIVGTLWDVTDKDIDRFALECFEHWGLLQKGEGDLKAKKKVAATKIKGRVQNGMARGNSRRRSDMKGRGQVTLDEAVVRARDACVLRYLNGAAVVLYGLPTVLEQ